MIITFQNEELVSQSGAVIRGTIQIHVAAFQTSFAYAFGSEAGHESEEDFELTVESFVPDKPERRYETPEARRALRALLEAWVSENEAKVIAAWRKACE